MCLFFLALSLVTFDIYILITTSPSFFSSLILENYFLLWWGIIGVFAFSQILSVVSYLQGFWNSNINMKGLLFPNTFCCFFCLLKQVSTELFAIQWGKGQNGIKNSQEEMIDIYKNVSRKGISLLLKDNKLAYVCLIIFFLLSSMFICLCKLHL